MSEAGQLLEPEAEQILGDIRAELITRLRNPANDKVLPDLPRDAEIHAFSAAVSAKRSADALERIADALEVGNGLQMVIHDNDLDGKPNVFVENVCSAIARRLK